jgi:hypothetical protein
MIKLRYQCVKREVFEFYIVIFEVNYDRAYLNAHSSVHSSLILYQMSEEQMEYCIPISDGFHRGPKRCLSTPRPIHIRPPFVRKNCRLSNIEANVSIASRSSAGH